MFFDTAKIKGNKLVTHRIFYQLDKLTAGDIERPILHIVAVPTIGAGAICWAFRDILFLSEILSVAGLSFSTLLVGACVGRFHFASSDLRGSELKGRVWGSLSHLRDIKTEIEDRIENAGGRDDQA